MSNQRLWMAPAMRLVLAGSSNVLHRSHNLQRNVVAVARSATAGFEDSKAGSDSPLASIFLACRLRFSACTLIGVTFSLCFTKASGRIDFRLDNAFGVNEGDEDAHAPPLWTPASSAPTSHAVAMSSEAWRGDPSAASTDSPLHAAASSGPRSAVRMNSWSFKWRCTTSRSSDFCRCHSAHDTGGHVAPGGPGAKTGGGIAGEWQPSLCARGRFAVQMRL
mmetsp:Transcript_57247/g.166106  ORF Transcript_57247/g.166106 Transcript_57247/m.166106 type:complete len:220 (+) Transcript_57247:1083-1742(+)